MQTHVCGPPEAPLLQVNEDQNEEIVPFARVYTDEPAQDQQGSCHQTDGAILIAQQQQPNPSKGLLKECDQCHKAFK
jgi:hypothetical protein